MDGTETELVVEALEAELPLVNLDQHLGNDECTEESVFFLANLVTVTLGVKGRG